MALQLADLKPFVDWLQVNPGFATLAVFLISCAESLAIIGLFIPGTIVMPAIGSMVGAGVLPGYWIVFAAILGAIVGDNFSYWLGCHYHNQIRAFWPFNRVPKMLDHGERFFNKYGGFSVFIGRFVGPVRPIIPVVAGMFNMSPARFILANVLSAIGWALVYMAPGMLLGVISEELAPHVAARLLLIFTIALLVIWLVSWILNKLCNYLYKKFEILCKALWLKTGIHLPQLNKILLHQHVGNYKPLSIIFYILLFVLGLMSIVISVTRYKMIPYFDWPVFLFLRSIDIPPLDTLMAYAYNLTSTLTLVSIGAALALWLIAHKSWRILFYWSANLAFSFLIMLVLQHFIPMAPPDVHRKFYSDYTFPNISLGIFSALLGNFLILSYYTNSWLRYKKLFLLLLLFLIGCATLPKIYFGFYWLSSCIASVVCAALSTWFCILFFYRKRVFVELKSLFFIAAMAMCIATIGISVKSSQWFIMQLDKPQFTISGSFEKWRNNESLPLLNYRENILGKAAEPLSIQYAGSSSALIQTLESKGWQVAPKASVAVILNRIGAKNRADQLPLFPDLYFSEKPHLVMTKLGDASHKMLIIRLWSSGILLEPGHIPLWVGTIHYHAPWHWRREKDILNMNAFALSILQNDLAKFSSELVVPNIENCRLFCSEKVLKVCNDTGRLKAACHPSES